MSFPFNFRPMDEEEFKKMQERHLEHHQRMALMNQEFINRWVNFIDDLSPEDKRTLIQFLQRMDSAEYGLVWLNYWQGNAAASMRIKHPNFCMDCGTEHNQITEPCQDVFGNPIQHESVADPVVPDEQLPVTQAGPPDDDLQGSESADEIAARVESEYQTDLKTYNLQPYTKKDEDDTRSGFECRKCGHFYSSLSERMLRDPDECPGCIHKEKWG